MQEDHLFAEAASDGLETAALPTQSSAGAAKRALADLVEEAR